MASGSFGVSTSNGYISGSINWSESQQNSSNDTSVVYAEMRLSRTNSGYTSSGTDDFWISINGTTIHSGQIKYSLTQNSNTLMVSGSVAVTHNPDGSKAITISWGGGGGSGGVFTVNSSSGTAYLDTLPRASTLASSASWTAGTQNLAISLNVADSSFHHSVQIFVQHTYDGNWDFIGGRDNIGSSTTWQFTQAEITQIYSTNNMYENRPVIVRVFTYNSSGSQIGGYQDANGTVYAVPTAYATFANFNIGNSINYTLQNYTSGSAGGFTYDLTMTIGSFTKTWAATTAQTGTLTFTTAEVQSIYAQIPNTNTATGTMTVRTKYNGVYTEDGIPDTHDSSFACYVTGSNPNFGTGYTYADTNSTVVGITNNNQYIVQNQSKLTVTLPKASAATAVNAATMSYYTFTAANTAATMYIPTTAPTLGTTSTGGLLAAGTYYVVYTWVNSIGESYSSPETSIVIPTGTTTNKITVTIPSLPTGVTSANIYISTAAGTETKQGNTTSTTYTQTAALVAGTATPSMTINLGTINASANTNLQVKAVDSRGNYTTTSINVNIVPYSAPTITATATRNNGFDVTTVLKLNGVASAVSISSVNKNSIVSAQYQTRQKGGSFGSLTNFSIIGFPSYSATDVTLTLDNTLAWDINFVVTDKFGTTSVIQSVTAGTPILAIDSVKKSFGFGQFPTHNNALEMTGDFFVNGTPAAPATATLSNGANTLVVTQNTPVSIQSIKGRTLVNLLGGTGSFEVSLTPYNWTNWYAAESATIAVDSTINDGITGNYSCKITSTASGHGEAYNVFQTHIDTSAYYVVVGMAKNYNASGGVGCGFFNIGNANQLRTCAMTTSTNWTPVFVGIQPSQLTGVTQFQIYGAYIEANASGQYGWVDGVRWYKITQAEYNALSGMTAQQVATKYPYVDGVQGIMNPTIDYNGTKMTVETTLYSNADGSVYDELFIDTDGKLKKRQWFGERYLDGRFNWASSGGATSGFHEFYAPLSSVSNIDESSDYWVGNPTWSWLMDPYNFVYYRNSPGSSNPWQFDFNASSPPTNTIWIDVPDSITGWGSGYAPSADEVRAFMYGWKMYPSSSGNGTGTYTSGSKYFCDPNFDGTYTEGQSQTPNYQQPRFIPWKLVYQRTSANIIDMNPTGQVLLPTGTNTATLQQNVIVREKVNPVNFSGNNTVYLNSLTSQGNIFYSKFKYPCAQVLKIEKGTDDDTANWTITNWTTGTNDTNGLQRLTTTPDKFNPDYDYFVTYIALNSSAPADQMGISYPQSFRGLFDYTLNTIVNHENRLDSLQLTYARRQQSPWISLVGMNGWTWQETFAEPCIMKDEFGFVHLKGSFNNGTNTSGTVITVFPVGYRPSEKFFVPLVGWNGSGASGNGPMSLYINTDGTLTCDNGVATPGNIALNQIPPFKAYY